MRVERGRLQQVEQVASLEAFKAACREDLGQGPMGLGTWPRALPLAKCVFDQGDVTLSHYSEMFAEQVGLAADVSSSR